MRSNIHASLRGTALDWYTVQLTEFERRSLRRLPLSDGWYAVLVARFKLRASQALNKLRDLSYSPEEVLKGKSVRAFAQAVFRYSQAAGLSTQHNQLTQAWTKLHPNLRRDIPEPKETTEVAEFLAHLEAKEDIWRDIENASQRRGNHQNQNRHFSMHGRPYGQRDPLVNPYQSNQGFSNQNYLPYKKYYPEHRRYHPEQQGRNQYGPPQNPPTNPASRESPLEYSTARSKYAF